MALPDVARNRRHLLIFFSSRRRHTRFSRDWSSDVCSSDLSSRSSRREHNLGGVDFQPPVTDGILTWRAVDDASMRLAVKPNRTLSCCQAAPRSLELWWT